uniref:Uncharacterized protein n=1 Tax=Alexandrium monilatum TaxID=311494 RepID=A0A7S4UA10_9DINO
MSADPSCIASSASNEPSATEGSSYGESVDAGAAASPRRGAHFASQDEGDNDGSSIADAGADTRAKEPSRTRKKSPQHRGHRYRCSGEQEAGRTPSAPSRSSAPFGTSALGHEAMLHVPSRAPGPCHYDPELASPRVGGTQDAAFRSATPRLGGLARLAAGGPGPGSYDCRQAGSSRLRVVQAKRAWANAPPREKALAIGLVRQHELAGEPERDQPLLFVSAQRCASQEKDQDAGGCDEAPGLNSCPASQSRPSTRSMGAAAKGTAPIPSRPSTHGSVCSSKVRSGRTSSLAKGPRVKGCVRWSPAPSPFWTDWIDEPAKTPSTEAPEEAADTCWVGPDDLPSVPGAKRQSQRPHPPSSSASFKSRSTHRSLAATPAKDADTTPGPGHYPSAPSRPPAESKAPPCFGSAQPRGLQAKVDVAGPKVGPGAYAADPFPARRSPPRTDRAVPLGGHSSRWSSTAQGSSGPGPGSYSSRGRTLAEALAAPVAPGDTSFGTRLDRFPTSARGPGEAWERPGRALRRYGYADPREEASTDEGTPAPGAYHCEETSKKHQPRQPPGTEGFLASEPRFPRRRSRDDHMPGPGAYDPRDLAAPVAQVHDFGVEQERWPPPPRASPEARQPLGTERLEPDVIGMKAKY